MAVYEYQALTDQGESVKGTQEADSARQVRQTLRDKGWTPLDVSQVVDKKCTGEISGFSLGQSSGITSAQLALITRQLATLIQAAMPIEEALKAVADQQEKSKIRNVMMAIRSKILEGHTLAKSMEAFPSSFPKMYRATIAAGEQAGYLDKVLTRLADHTEQRMQSQQKVKLALMYPIILMLVSIGIVSFLLGYVVPDIIKVFVNSGQALPLITRVLVFASEGFQQYWLVILLSVACVVWTSKWLLRKPNIRMNWHKRVLCLPVIGRFSRTLNTSQFASTLSILIRSGVSLVDALRISAQVVSNDAVRASVESAAKRVSEGISLHRALSDTHYFPPLMLHMIASGEATGELDVMLDRTAHNQELELENRTSMMIGLLEPLVLVFMGAIVLIVVLAILLPIINMNNLVG